MSFRINLETDQVQHIPPAQPVRVTPDTSVRVVIARMRAEGTGSVLVCRDDVLVGIFTERDVIKMMAADQGFDGPIEQVMTADPTTIKTTETVAAAIQRMSSGGYRRLPIVGEDGQIVAVLKVSQILNYLVEHFPQYIYNLPPAPHHTLHEREGA